MWLYSFLSIVTIRWIALFMHFRTTGPLDFKREIAKLNNVYGQRYMDDTSKTVLVRMKKSVGTHENDRKK